MKVRALEPDVMHSFCVFGSDHEDFYGRGEGQIILGQTLAQNAQDAAEMFTDLFDVPNCRHFAVARAEDVQWFNAEPS